MRIMPDLRASRADRREAAWRRMQWLVVVSAAVSEGGLVMMAVSLPGPWRWSLFWWGLAIAAVGVVINESLLRVLPRLVDLPQRRPIVAAQRRTYSLAYITAGLLLGSCAAAVDVVWIDVVGTLYVVAVWIATLIVLPVVLRRKRRRRAAPTGNAG